MPKPFPSSVSALRVPNRDFAYFEGAGKLPFRSHARDFDIVNAWWLAELSFLSYVKEPLFVQERLRTAGFDGAVFIDRNDVHCFITYDARSLIVCFRGTDVTSLRNLLTDVDIKHADFSGAVRVHRGFRDALDLIWPQVSRQIDERAEGRSVFVTGHSLGGALATLTAARRRGGRLYTFGCPRVGDRGFRNRFPMTRCYRVVNDHDVITELPPPMGYRHVGRLIHLRRNGTVEDGTTPWERLKDNVTERFPGIVKSSGDLKELWENVVRENALADHAPINYAIRIWNLLEKRLSV